MNKGFKHLIKKTENRQTCKWLAHIFIIGEQMNTRTKKFTKISSFQQKKKQR